ncbi:MAG: AAA family ATPase [Chloroflexota bacterium]
MAKDIQRQLLKTSEVARRLRVNSATVARYIRQGMLGAITTQGGHYRISEGDLLAFRNGLDQGEENRLGHAHGGAYIMCIANPRSGSGKTTVTFELGMALYNLGGRVLFVDMDPHADLSARFGVTLEGDAPSIVDAMLDRTIGISDVIVHTTSGPDLAPNGLGSFIQAQKMYRMRAWGVCLQRFLQRLRSNYDYILIDAPSDLNTLAVCALGGADSVLIPASLEIATPLEIELLLDSLQSVRDEVQPGLLVLGAVSTSNTALSASSSTANSAGAETNIIQHVLTKRRVRQFQHAVPIGPPSRGISSSPFGSASSAEPRVSKPLTELTRAALHSALRHLDLAEGYLYLLNDLFEECGLPLPGERFSGQITAIRLGEGQREWPNM